METKQPRVSGDGLSREIKFRCWEYGEMNYDPSCQFYDSEINFEFQNKIDRVYMQYTGLKDKKGKEIYEGDICKQIDPYNQNFDIEFGVDFLYQSHSLMVWDNENKLEVIGNVFENPELLETTKPTT